MWIDSKHPERELWTKYTFSVVNSVYRKLNLARDIIKFCPNYDNLERPERVAAWSQLFASIANWESGFDPLNDTLEKFGSAGYDPVAKGLVYSDGLLQLSYQDILDYPQYCHFDIDHDRKLPRHDIHRTIFNPYNNLYCGIHIMAEQVKKQHLIVVKKDNYWATLQPGNFFENRVKKIKRDVGQYPLCNE